MNEESYLMPPPVFIPAPVPNVGTRLAEVEAALTSKANVSAIPRPATAMPPGVSDAGAVGSQSPYARADHTHASKARKPIVTMGAAAMTYAWVYPSAFADGVVPIVSAIVQVPIGNTDLFNVQVMGAPTNSGCVFQINRVSSGLLSLLTGALSINPTPIKATLHMLALEP